MITNLRFTNFKSWSDTGDLRFGRLTGFFGPNSSGKSSLIQFLLMLKQTRNSRDRSLVLDLGQDGDETELVHLGGVQNVLHSDGGPTKTRLDWSISWKPKDSVRIDDPDKTSARLFNPASIALDVDLDLDANGNRAASALSVRSMAYSFPGASGTVRIGMERTPDAEDRYKLESDGYVFRRIQGRAWPLPRPAKSYAFPDQVNSYFQNAGFLNQFAVAFEDLMDSIYYLGPLRDYPRRQYTWSGAEPSDMGRRGEFAISALLSSPGKSKISRGQGRPARSLDLVVAEWLQKLGLVHSFRIEEIARSSNLYRVLVRQSSGSSEVIVSDVGFGVSQVLPVITLCYYVPVGSTIILEQPEIHLHPSVQAGLADVFIDAVKTRKVQLIVESHSEHLLTRLQLRMAQEKLDPALAAFYFCERGTSRSIARSLELDRFGNITNWPKGFFGDEFAERAEMMRAIAARSGFAK